MKVFLMYPDRDFDPNQELPPNVDDLIQDLELNVLLQTMAQGDPFLFAVAKQALLRGLDDIGAIRYRQEILRDCLNNPDVVRQIYRIPIKAMENKRQHWLGISGWSPTSMLSSARALLEMLVEMLKTLRAIADEHAPKFQSEGFARFFGMIQRELDDEYLAGVEAHLKTLQFRRGVLVSAELGKGNEGANYILRQPDPGRRNWVGQILNRTPAYSYRLHPRDEAGARVLGDLRDRGLSRVADAVARAADHVERFFDMLRLELAFYIGCLNLSEQLARLREPISFPVPVDAGVRRHSFRGLYDVCLALTMKQKVVGNDVNADDKSLVIITGANQGGKSTFLRSIGLAQLMMQCGMFVPAESLCANICGRLFTHYKREEDSTMKSGKLDEELGRMSGIVDQIIPNSMVLFNESFAATNEREGSEIARQIVTALLEKRIKVFFVTHQYEFAHSMCRQDPDSTMSLRAERLADGTRTFRLIEGEPLQTSYGKDLYNNIFGAGSQAGALDEMDLVKPGPASGVAGR